MKSIHVNEIIEQIKEVCMDANYNLNKDVEGAIIQFRDKEQSALGKDILGQMLQNADIARNKQMPICQDTGMAVFFVSIGQDVHIEGGSLEAAINEGVRQGYEVGYLRKSVVKDPLIRENTKDNTPAVIHYEIVQGEELIIDFAPKGFGSENMSQIKMLKPSDGIEGVKKFIVNTVKEAGPNPCPPVVVGVGVGGTFEKAALLAKKALLRPIGSQNDQEHIRNLEKEVLESINQLGIGPQGLGGNTTAFCVNIETYPTHIAGLPVAVNISCHVTRHGRIVL